MLLDRLGNRSNWTYLDPIVNRSNWTDLDPKELDRLVSEIQLLSLFFGGDKDLVELHERKHQENFLWQSFNETYVNCLIQLNSVSCNDQLSNWKLKCRYFKLTADL